MAERVFKLNTSAVAIRAVRERFIVVAIPADAIVVIVSGNINGNGFVKIRYCDAILEMSAKDLRSRGEWIVNSSA